MSLETPVCGRTGEKGGFVPGVGTRLKRWAGLRSVKFSLRVWERDRILGGAGKFSALHF